MRNQKDSRWRKPSANWQCPKCKKYNKPESLACSQCAPTNGRKLNTGVRQ